MTLDSEPLYTRQLPGGGYVVIEATRHDAEVSLRLYVERRVRRGLRFDLVNHN